MITNYEKKYNIFKIIKKKNNYNNCDISELENYIKVNHINLKDLNNERFDILTSIINLFEEPFFKDDYYCFKIIKYILEECKYETLNYTFNFRKENNLYIGSVPLYCALYRNKLKLADLLIKYGADINYRIYDSKNFGMNIISYLCYKNYYYGFQFGPSIIKYILNRGLKITEVDRKLIYFLISHNKYDILETMLDFFIFDTNLVLNFLFIYKNKNSMSKQEIYDIIQNAKAKIKIKESIYEVAIYTDQYDAIKILLEYDGSSIDIIINRIEKLGILEKALQFNHSELIKKILSYESINVNNLKFEKYIIDASRDYFEKDIIKLFINLLKVRNFDFNIINYEDILLEASKRKNIDIMKILMELLLNVELDKFEDLNISKIKNYDQCFLSLILNVSIKINNLQLVTYLLENDDLTSIIDINIKDRNNEYPIIVAYYATKYFINKKENTANSIEIFKYLLTKGSNLDATNKSNLSLLNISILDQEYMILKYILKQKLPVDERDIRKYSHPLIKSICKNNIENVRSQIKKVFKPTDINNKKQEISYAVKSLFSVTSACGFTPLILSYLLNRHEITKLLMNKLVLDIKDLHGYSLLHYAIIKEDIGMIYYLIKNRADINYDKFAIFALDTAIKIGNKKIFLLLLNCEYILLDTANELGDTPLLTLIKSHNFSEEDKKDLVEELLKKDGCDVNYIENWAFYGDNDDENNGNSALIYAIREGHLSITQLLVENGAKINEIYENGNSPLKSAIKCESLPIIEYLIAQGADINLKDSNHDTPLIYAIQFTNKQSLPIIKLLITHHSDINIVNKYEKTPLIYAFERKSLPIIKMLVDHGADVNYDLTIFPKAIKVGPLSIIEYLLEHGLHHETNQELEYYELINEQEQHRKIEIIKLLAKYKMDFFSFNVMREIIRDHQVNMIKILINNHFDINIKDENDQTLIVYAQLFHQKKIMNYLYDYKTNYESLSKKRYESNQKGNNKRLKIK